MDKKFINRRTALKGVASIGLAGSLSTSIGTASAKAPISKKNARRTAKNAVEQLGQGPEFEEWSHTGVKTPQLFYSKVRGENGVQYQPRAWVFPIENQGDDVGYITVDATQEYSPVLAFGESRAPQREFNNTKKAAQAHGKSVHKRFLYHGGVEYGVETADNKLAGLRGNYIRDFGSASSIEDLQPPRPGKEENASQADDGNDSADDWDGTAEAEVTGVPDWTETDDGGASSTNYGTGKDAWDSWDGCIPIAGSMVVGYHENLSNSDDEDREALIDRLHDGMKTSSDGWTTWSDVDNGIRNYSHGSHSYDADNQHFELKGNVKDEVDTGRPIVLNMEGSDYGDHSVAVFGYRRENCGTFGCDTFYHKVYNGWSDSGADQILNGDWSDACVTRVKKSSSSW